jgi:glycogen debranching enzyme
MEPNLTDWGVRDTYPYRDPFSHRGGNYHNGGVWVFLNFADALSRFVTGYPARAFDILKRVGEWDLEKAGDYLPAEYLDGNTGANCGIPIQAWDAAGPPRPGDRSGAGLRPEGRCCRCAPRSLPGWWCRRSGCRRSNPGPRTSRDATGRSPRRSPHRG